MLHNYPLILIEFISKCLSSDNFAIIENSATEEGMLNFSLENSENFGLISMVMLYKISSLFCIANPHKPTLFFNETIYKIFETIFGSKARNLSEFSDFSQNFVRNFSTGGENLIENFIFASLFLEYANSQNSDTLSKNTMFYGAIGAGKTRQIRQILANKKVKNSHFRLISFHKSYDYADFIDGFVGGNFINGEFKNICKMALKEPQSEFYLVIDNANSGNFDEIFGETLELLERRFDENDDLTLIRTKNSHIIDSFDEAKKAEFSVIVRDGLSYFAVPKNLFVICATNGKNHRISPSSAKIFSWEKLNCDYSLIENFLNEKGVKNSANYGILCKKLNDFISKDSRLGFEIGHGVFMQIENYAINSQITQESINRFLMRFYRRFWSVHI